jgi:hypothetical protein
MYRFALSASTFGVLIGVALVAYAAISPRPVHAAVEHWQWHSWIQHSAGQAQWTKPLGVIASSPWLSPYNSAINAWNSDIGDDPFIPVGWDQYAQVHTVEANSWDEYNLDWWMVNQYLFQTVYSCQQADDADPQAIWGSVAPYYNAYWDDPHRPPHSQDEHFHSYKVCIWPSRIPATSTWRSRTIRHELGHVLSLGDDVDGDACLMKNGLAMTNPCASELNKVRSHYNR